MNLIIDLILKLFSPLDGRKSYIGGAMMAAAVFIRAVMPQYSGLADVLEKLGMALLGVGIAHKLAKIEPPKPEPIKPE